MSFHTEPYVMCDECGTKYRAPIKRAEMLAKGWTMRGGWDFCPKCDLTCPELPAIPRKAVEEAEKRRAADA